MAGSRGTSSAFAGLLGALAVLYLAAAGCENEGQPDVTPPAQVLDLSASARSTCSISLKWTASGDDGFAGRSTAYDLRYSTSAISAAAWDAATRCEGLPAPAASGSQEHFLVAGLVADTKYYFKMVVADESGNVSDLSNAGIAATLPPESAPGVVWVRDGLAGDDQDWTNLTSELSATWASAEGATGYQYSIGTSPGGRDIVDWRTASGAAVTAVTHSDLALAPGSTYYFSVRALLEGGCSGYGTSDGITVDIAAPASRVRALPDPTCHKPFRVTWTGGDDLSGLVECDIQVRDAGGGDWADWITATAETTSLYEGSDGHTYAFRSRARDLAGNQEAYPESSDARTLLVLVPQVWWVYDGLGADVSWWASSTELSANWAWLDKVDGYEYAIETAGGNHDVVDWVTAGDRTYITHRGLSLQHGEFYKFSVRAVRDGCHGRPMASDGVVIDCLLPSSQVDALPETTYAHASGYTHFPVSWTGKDLGSGVARFDVQYRLGDEVAWTDWQTGTSLKSVDFRGLVGLTYYFRCRAKDRAGNLEPYADGYDAYTYVAQGSVPPPPPPPPPPINTDYKMALHVVRHGAASCKNPPVIESVDGLNRVWHELDQDGIDVFFVIFDFDSILTLEFGLNWPADWGTASFHVCQPCIQLGSIVSPGDGVAMAYNTCQVPTTQGGTRPPFWTMCYAWLVPQSEGEIEIWPNPATGDMCVVDCRDLQFRRKAHPTFIYNAGVNTDPWEGPPT